MLCPELTKQCSSLSPKHQQLLSLQSATSAFRKDMGDTYFNGEISGKVVSDFITSSTVNIHVSMFKYKCANPKSFVTILKTLLVE